MTSAPPLHRAGLGGIGGDLAPSLGDGKKFRRPRFPRKKLPFFRKKLPFSRPKFLMTFLVIAHDCRIFLRFSMSLIAPCNVVYDPFFTRKPPISENNSLMTPFSTLFVLYTHIRQALLLKILGGRIHGPSPTSNFGGSPPSPP